MEQEERQRTAAGATLTVYWLGAFVVGFLLVHGAAWPQGGVPLSSGVEQRTLRFSGAVESWQFFEKDLQLDHVLVFRHAGERWQKIAPSANAAPENFFGISRRPRKDAVERGRLLAQLKKDDWRRCDGDLDACIDAAPTVRVANGARDPAYCGSFALVRREQIPWSWTGTPSPTYPTFATRIEATC